MSLKSGCAGAHLQEHIVCLRISPGLDTIAENVYTLSPSLCPSNSLTSYSAHGFLTLSLLCQLAEKKYW